MCANGWKSSRRTWMCVQSKSGCLVSWNNDVLTFLTLTKQFHGMNLRFLLKYSKLQCLFSSKSQRLVTLHGTQTVSYLSTIHPTPFTLYFQFVRRTNLLDIPKFFQQMSHCLAREIVTFQRCEIKYTNYTKTTCARRTGWDCTQDSPKRPLLPPARPRPPRWSQGSFQRVQGRYGCLFTP